MFNTPISALFNIFYPKVCLACNYVLTDFENTICTKCRHDLPVLNLEYDNTNLVKKTLYGRVNVFEAMALIKFEKKGIVQHLMHELKYKNQEQLSAFFGNWLGEILKTNLNFNTVDVVIPVPLHQNKFNERGYNQVDGCAQALAKHLNAEFNNTILLKTKNTNSQVYKSRLERWQLNNELFITKNLNSINGKHILLVDDIITTGATIEACANELLKANNIKISVASIAIA